MKVILLDDSTMNRMIVQKTLSSSHVDEVIEANNAIEAYELFRESDAGMIFVNWKLVPANDLAWIEDIRKINSEVPIVMLVKECQRQKFIQAHRNGVTDYLVTPLSPSRLIEKVEKWSPSPALV